MEGKLIKTEVNYILEDDKGVIIASNSLKKEGLSLSLKNCEAIANGYDLEELAIESSREYFIKPIESPIFTFGYEEGFQKALEVTADKRFTLKEMVECWNRALEFQEHKETLGEYIQSLQQTEWDVEVCCYIGNGDKESDSFKDPIVTNTGIPKLDEDNCLILKRI